MKSLAWLFALASIVLGAQAPEATKTDVSRVIGEVKSLVGTERIDVKTDEGTDVDVLLQEKTLYLRVPPGETDLKKATRITFKDIAQGDRVLARGKLSEDKKSIAAVSVILMTKEELAQKHERDRAEWVARGVSGQITSMNSQTQEVVVTLRDQKTMVVGPVGSARFRRYAPDSVRFSDAKPSTFAELKIGDQIRVLGDKSEDGSRLKPEEVISGTFRNIAGTVKMVNAAAGEVQIMDLVAKKPMTVKVNADSVLRRLPSMGAMMSARAAQSGGQGGSGAARPAGAGAGGPGGMKDIQKLLEQIPAMPIADLKPGDAIIVSTTSGTEPASVTAITLIAGVEPFLTAAPRGGGQQISSSWNFGGDMGAGMPQ